MKIIPIINNTVINNSAPAKKDKTFSNSTFEGKVQDLNNIPHYVPFKARERNNLECATQYLEKRKAKLKNRDYQIWDFDLDKLEGIQSGIKVFEGTTLKEIAFLAENLLMFPVLRGCNNNCAHCFADAKPEQKETDNLISRMDYEDFIDFANGFKELNNRLGFNIFNVATYEYLAFFYDADCSQIYLKDKDGNIHDWEDLARTMYEATQTKQLFDTAGWYIQDKAAQKRMEKYIASLTKPDANLDFLATFNVSINPFHAMQFKSFENVKKGDFEKAEFLMQKNSQRIANMLFTVTPILNIDESKVKFLVTAVGNDVKNNKGFSLNDLIEIYKEHVFKNLKDLYIQDYKTEQKIIKDEKDIDTNIKKFQELLTKRVNTFLVINKGLKNIYDENHHLVKRHNSLSNLSAKDTLKNGVILIVDANGDVYGTNNYKTFKTDIKLNFKNKDKKTAKIGTNLTKERITRKLVDKYTDKKDNSQRSSFTFINIIK